MRYDIPRGWTKINESGGTAQNVSQTAEIEISRNEDNGGMIIEPGQSFEFTSGFYARRHKGGGACILAVFEGKNVVDVNVGSINIVGSIETATDEDIMCLFKTHGEYVSGSSYHG